LFHNVIISGKGLLEFWDALLINCFLPIIAFGMSLALSYGLSESEKQQHFVNNSHIESVILYPYWKFILRYFVPSMIAIAMALQVIGIFY
jgi:SNF family Na+-dependent transporter